MSSGRRPNGSHSPSAWRSMSMSKRRAPPSVSFVFAEPEQGAPLQSAATKLPPAAYNNDNIMRKRERLESTSTLRDDDKDSASISGASIKRIRVGTQAGASVDSLQSAQDATQSSPEPEPYRTAQWEGLVTETPKSTSPDVALPPTQTLNIPFPTTKSSTAPKPSPTGSSWFRSLSMSKGMDSAPKVISLDEGPNKDDARNEGQPVPAADAIVSQAPAEPKPAAATPDTEPPAHYPPQQIPVQSQAHRGWFSPSPSSPTPPPPPPKSRPSVSPITPRLPNSHSHSTSIASIPSSIDEEVPKLSVLTPPNTPGPVNVMQNAGSGSSKLSSLNPSTSRFMLSIPLLGRPKIPLDRAVAVVVAGGSQKGQSDETVQGTETKPEQAAQIDQTSQTTTIPTPTPQTESSTEQQTLLKPPEDQTRDTSLASWWGYVGWNKSDTLPVLETSSSSKPTSHPSPSSSDAPTIRAVKSDPQLPVSAMAAEPRADALPQGNSTGGDAALLVPTNVVKDKAQSVFSAGTTQTQGSATWYVPWTWYERSSTNVDGEVVEREADAKTVMTQSEMVKEEALARDRDPVGTVPDIEITAPSSLVSPAAEERNPIESTVSSNKSGWTSFFSSRSLAVKTITDGKDKNGGMEVMNIDEDEGSPDLNAISAAASAPMPIEEKKLKDADRAVPGPQSQTKLKPHVDPKASEKPKIEKPKDDKSKPPALPLTNSESVKRDKPKVARRNVSPTPSAKSGGNKSPGSPRIPNLVLPTWTDTFHTAPRSLVPSVQSSTIAKTLDFVSAVLFSGDKERMKKGKARDKELTDFGKELPKAFDVLGEKLEPDVLRGCSKAVIIGVHGWFPGAVMRTVLGDPTGTSGKFVDMMLQALDEFQEKHHVKLKTITKIPLEGEGTINKRVDKLYNSLLANTTWMKEIHAADVIFVATHSQGCVVSTHLLDRLIRDGHIRTHRNMRAPAPIESLASSSTDIVPIMQPQKICCLALCGIHLGPLRYLSTSSLLQPYFQYFESAAARELFEFQDTESEVSKQYALALTHVMHHGTKMVYIASLNDQVVPLYSGLFITATHPLILRALYIDGDAYQSSDFLSNLLVLLLRVLNSGISDSGLLTHLSEATAGSLNGVGHSTVYEELATYSLAVDYCFLANDGLDVHPELVVDPFDAKTEQNDYEIPWALRDVIADERVAHFFSDEIVKLRDAFREWLPKTTILRDIKKKLQPIQRLPSSILKDSVSRL